MRQGRSQHRTTREGASGRSPTMQYRTERKRSAVRGVRTWGELANGSEAHYEGHKALWALSHCGPVDYALDKRYFADEGLLSLEHRYREMHCVIAPAQLTLALD